jgi:hypothetical protein
MHELQQNYQVTFLHPRTGDTWPVNVSSGLTADEALAGLTKYGFLAPLGNASLVLSIERTGKTLPARSTFADAGVQAGDRLSVVEVHEGHAPCEALSCPR